VNDDVPREDAQLVEATLAGDPDAFGALVQRHQDRLFNTLAHVLGSRDDARDVVQDAFIQALVKLDAFRGEAKFYTWLYRIAMNLAHSHRRRLRPTVSIDEAKTRAGAEPADTQQDAERRMIEQERAQAVQAALACLEDGPRQILVLREMEGCSYETIADILELPIGTVRSRLFRARLQLKDQLQKLLRDEMDPNN